MTENISLNTRLPWEKTPKQNPDHSAAQMSAMFADGSLCPTQLAEEVIARVRELEPRLNAFYLFDETDVREQAAASAQRWRAGAQLSAFDGVPVTLKENISRAGKPKPGGTAIPNPQVAGANAPITDRLLEAGCVVLGSTTMPDWGMLSSGVSSLHGITRQALNPAHTSGGSSAGAGTAAAATYAPFNIGTDIGGSIRLPGSWQGVTALKPSDGLIPLDVPYAGRAAGPMARSVEDTINLMSIVARPDERDYLARPYPVMEWSAEPLSPAGMRVAVQFDAGSGLPVESETRAVLEKAVQLFADAGAQLIEIEPFVPAQALEGLVNFWRSRSYADYRVLTAAEREGVLPFIANWCVAGADFSASDTVRGREQIDVYAKLTRERMRGFDLLISPVSPVAAFPAEDPMPITDPFATMGHISFTVPFNMSGHPALSIDAGCYADGRRVGLQIVGQLGEDPRLLRVARWFEQTR